jgi:hypothetical protein
MVTGLAAQAKSSLPGFRAGQFWQCGTVALGSVGSGVAPGRELDATDLSVNADVGGVEFTAGTATSHPTLRYLTDLSLAHSRRTLEAGWEFAVNACDELSIRCEYSRSRRPEGYRGEQREDASGAFSRRKELTMSPRPWDWDHKRDRDGRWREDDRRRCGRR